MVGVLLQKNHEGHEQPIYFYSKTLRDAPMKYNILDKRAYFLEQDLRDFCVYKLHSHIIDYVSTSAIKDIMTQPDPEE